MLETQCQLSAHYERVGTLTPSKGAAQIQGALLAAGLCLPVFCLEETLFQKWAVTGHSLRRVVWAAAGLGGAGVRFRAAAGP